MNNETESKKKQRGIYLEGVETNERRCSYVHLKERLTAVTRRLQDDNIEKATQERSLSPLRLDIDHGQIKDLHGVLLSIEGYFHHRCLLRSYETLTKRQKIHRPRKIEGRKEVTKETGRRREGYHFVGGAPKLFLFSCTP